MRRAVCQRHLSFLSSSWRLLDTSKGRRPQYHAWTRSQSDFHELVRVTGGGGVGSRWVTFAWKFYTKFVALEPKTRHILLRKIVCFMKHHRTSRDSDSILIFFSSHQTWQGQSPLHDVSPSVSPALQSLHVRSLNQPYSIYSLIRSVRKFCSRES